MLSAIGSKCDTQVLTKDHMNKVNPKVLIFDIETDGINALKSDYGFCVMVGYKWSHEKDTKIITIKKKDLAQFNDGPLLEEFSAVYNEAVMTVAHFGSVFDRRFIQGRLLINKLPPLPFTKMRDTCMIARAVANFSSNRLVSLGKTLKLKHTKMEKGEGWPMWWYKVMQGDMKALDDMAAYCKDDVRATEELYYRLLPFDNAHPRMHPYDPEGRATCRVDGGAVTYRGTALAKNNIYRRFQCNTCGKWDQETKAIKR